MIETNYCAHAIDGLKYTVNCIDSNGPEYQLARKTSLEMIANIRKSVKFRIPDGGKIFDIREGESLLGFIEKYIQIIDLPYPVISIEYCTNDSFQDGEICIAYKGVIRDKNCIILSPVIRVNYPEFPKKQSWQPHSFGAALIIDQKDWFIFSQTEQGNKIGADSEYAERHMAGRLTTLLHFMAAMSCSNSATADAPPPNPSLNAKRKSSGKTPFFSYKVLTISSSGSNAKCTGAGGTHSSPRVHLRRGHIRRLTDRTVWVNSCVVGDKSKGMVVKDYQVTA